MHDFIVPRRARAVVAIIISGHVGVVLEPLGVVVDALECAERSIRARLSAWSDFGRKTAGGDLARVGRQVYEQPMEEINTRKAGRYAPPFLVTSSPLLGTSGSWQINTKD